jgi:4-alpha-glucanotransferase
MADLADEARRWGIEPAYHDIFGNWREVPQATLRVLVDALSAGRDAPSQSIDAHVPVVRRAYQGPENAVWGIAVQLYAVRSERNWGIGDFADLYAIVEIAAASGASAVGVNPLHALFLDRAAAASPYSPSSRRYLNPLYIAVDEAPGFAGTSSETKLPLEGLPQQDLVDYEAVASIKLASLRDAYRRFSASVADPLQGEFAAFREAGGDDLRRFACFEVLRERFHGRPWQDWPSPWRSADETAIADICASDSDACGFFEYLQWVADRQLGRCQLQAKALGMSIGLYLDIAVGVDPCGADAWAHQSQVLSGLSVGAPPDAYNPAGQNWGLAPFHPQAVSDNDFAALRALLTSAMRHAGAVRLDHVLGLMRLFLIPRGASPQQGAYVRYPFEQSLAVIAEESRRLRCIFIGEDLGTVPEGFRPLAARWGIWSYSVMMFERNSNGSFKQPGEYPQNALATFNTHDLPTFKGWIERDDLAIKRALGIDAGEDEAARTRARDALVDVLRPYAGPNPPDSFEAVASFLALTPSRLVMVAIDDLLEATDQINIPGTVDTYPNWRHKLPLPIDQWTEQPTFRATVEAFDNACRAQRR